MKESAASSLDEVVITGTGVQKKLTVTGAITTVNVSDLTHTANGNVVNALAGNVAGVLAMQNIRTNRVETLQSFGSVVFLPLEPVHRHWY